MVVEGLRFVHSHGYCHNDVKAQNLLVGLSKEDKDIVYLVDFGLACKYRDADGFHGEEEPDERKAHDGTLEYTSRLVKDIILIYLFKSKQAGADIYGPAPISNQ